MSESSEARGLRALVGEKAVQGPQLQREAVEAAVVAPGAGGAQQEPARASQPVVGRGGVVGVEHALEVADLLAQRLFDPGYRLAAPLRKVKPAGADPLVQRL